MQINDFVVKGKHHERVAAKVKPRLWMNLFGQRLPLPVV